MVQELKYGVDEVDNVAKEKQNESNHIESLWSHLEYVLLLNMLPFGPIILHYHSRHVLIIEQSVPLFDLLHF